jgi:hypothetical protein
VAGHPQTGWPNGGGLATPKWPRLPRKVLIFFFKKKLFNILILFLKK